MGKSSDRSGAALERRAEYVAARLSVIANPKRLQILCLLASGEKAVRALQEEVALSQSALSQHLAKLRDAGMVRTRREAQTIYYRLGDPELELLMSALYEVFCNN